MFLSLIVIIKTLKGRFMFSFHIDPDLKMLFEKLATQIGARPALGTKLRFEAAFGDLRVDINKVQRLTLGQLVCPLENGPRLVDSQLAVQTINKGCVHFGLQAIFVCFLNDFGIKFEKKMVSNCYCFPDAKRLI